MTSIRRRTATMVAVSVAVVLLLCGVLLNAMISQRLTSQFDRGLTARLEALQALTRFDGREVELDFSGEAMPQYSAHGGGDAFVVWVQAGDGWRELERADSALDAAWPELREVAETGVTHDCSLPDASRGRAISRTFLPVDDVDEEHSATTRNEHADGHEGAAEPGSAPLVRVFVAVPRSTLDDALIVVHWSIVAVGCVSLTACIVATVVAVRQGIRPLSELSDRVATVSANSLSTRLDAASLPEELRPIAEQLNELFARLDEAFQRETRFTSAASHELRTPIAELRMLLEVASSRERGREEWEETSRRALGVVDRAQSLTESLLTLARASETSRTRRTVGGTDVATIARECADRCTKGQPAFACEVCVEGESSVEANIDAAIMTSILGNLIENALKHGEVRERTPVRVKVLRVAQGVRVDISNQAPAMTTEHIALMFEPFWQSNEARNGGGIGLGLAVARALARANGGDVVASRTPDGLLTLLVTLPVVSSDGSVD